MHFVIELVGPRPSRRVQNGFSAASFALAGLALTTTWFVRNESVMRPDLFGGLFRSSIGGPGMGALGLFVAGSLAWAWWMLDERSGLPAGERFVLRAALVAYAGLGLTTIFSSLGLIPVQGAVELGPVAVSFAASHLLAVRQRDLEAELASQADRQTLALRESAERYRSLVDNAPLAVLVCDRNAELVAANRHVFTMIGSPHSTVQAQMNLKSAEQLGSPVLASLVSAAFASKRKARGEGRYVSTYGVAIETNTTVAPQLDERGEVSGALVLIEDVTERNAAQARLRQAQKMEAVGALAAGIAHEINDPMARVKSNLAGLRVGCEALRKQLAPGSRTDAEASGLAARFAEMEELLDESAEGVERAIAIAHDMRELSSGGAVAWEPVDLNRVLEGVLRMAAASRRPGSQLAPHYGDVPLVRGNVGQLRQVLVNLIVNALQAIGPGGRVDVETFAEGEQACVRVRDDGPGIALAHRDRLFEPFFTTKPAGEGTGLGLYLSYRIVESHGGEIHVDSQPGRGARFEVRLPTAGAERTP
jgi:PAS domain S-box-containing protein